MLTLSYGYKKPETGDRGSIFWPALEFDIQRLNDHNHDGSNTQKLLASSVLAISDTILAANWVAVAGQPGTYSQDITMLPNTLFDDYAFDFRITTVGPNFGKRINPTILKTAAAQFRIFSNDNTITLRVLYLV